MKKSADPDSLGQLNLDDILKFVRVFQRCVDPKTPPRDRSTVKALFAGDDLGSYTTTFGQMRRVIDFLFARVERSGRQAEVPTLCLKGAGFDVLFQEAPSDRGLWPTPAAEQLHRRFQTILSCYRDTKSRFVEACVGKANPHRVRVGGTQTVGGRLLPCILNDINAHLGAGDAIQLYVEIDNSTNLLERLNLGVLDLVVAFGPTDDAPHADYPHIRFDDLGYASRMVLLANPRAHLPLKRLADEDHNAAYWDFEHDCPITPSSRSNGSKRKVSLANTPSDKFDHMTLLPYEQLREIDLFDIDFLHPDPRQAPPPFIYVPSWSQPPAVEKLATQLRGSERYRECHSYERALALVRMNQGLTVASETYSSRGHITAFRLSPHEAYTRRIGFFYNTTIGLPAGAFRLAEFIRLYLATFEAEVRKGAPPVFFHEELDIQKDRREDKSREVMRKRFRQFLNAFRCRDAATDWAAAAAARVPVGWLENQGPRA